MPPLLQPVRRRCPRRGRDGPPPRRRWWSLLLHRNVHPSHAAQKKPAATWQQQLRPEHRQMATSVIAQILGGLNLLTFCFPESQHLSAAAQFCAFLAIVAFLAMYQSPEWPLIPLAA